MRSLRSGVLLLLILTPVARAGTPWLPRDAADSPALVRAHQAYLSGDLAALGTSVKDVLSDGNSDPLVRSNAVALMAKAFDDNCRSLPADWHVPAGVFGLKFGQTRTQQSAGVFYLVSISGATAAADTLASIKLRHFPDEIILDSTAKDDTWTTGPTKDGTFFFNLSDQKNRESPLESGLYYIDFKLKSGAAASGWFVLDDLLSTSSPTVLTPSSGEHFASGNPTARWQDFRSPEYHPCEGRLLTADVSQLVDQAPGWISVWDFWVRDPNLTSAVIGRDPIGKVPRTLTPGRYWLSLSYWEDRRFGELQLQRGSRTGRVFYVDAPAARD